MTTNPTSAERSVESVAAGLTKAQRKAVMWMNADGSPREHDSTAPREVSFWAIESRTIGDPAKQVAVTYSLCRRADGQRKTGCIWPPNTWALTPLGLAVRAHLTASEKKG